MQRMDCDSPHSLPGRTQHLSTLLRAPLSWAHVPKVGQSGKVLEQPPQSQSSCSFLLKFFPGVNGG